MMSDEETVNDAIEFEDDDNEEQTVEGAPTPEVAPGASTALDPEAEAAAEEERRRAYRLNKVLGATLTAADGETQVTRLFVIDISASGFRATDHQPHNDEEYGISVVLKKDEAPFASRMRVVWTKELTVSGMFQMGCEFIDPAPEELAKLQNFIDAERGKVETPKASMDLGRPWTMIR